MENLSKQTISIFWRFTRKYKLLVTGSIVFTIIGNIAEVYVPFLYKNFLDALSVHDGTSLPVIYRTLYIFIIVNILIWISSRISMGLNIKFQTKTMSDIANYCFKYLQNHSYSFFNNNFSGALSRKVSRYIKSYEELSNQATWRIAESIVKLAFVIIAFAIRNITLSLIVVIWTIFYFIFSFYIASKRQKIGLEKSEADSEVGAHLSDTIVNNLNLKIFSANNHEEKLHSKIIGKQFGLQMKAWLFDRDVDSYIRFFTIILEVTMLSVAVYLWRNGLLTVGDFALIQGLILLLFERLWNISYNTRMIYESLADANEMTGILLTPHEIQDRSNATDLKISNANIQIKNIDFSYNKRSIFNNFSLNIPGKQKVALVGVSGSGKTTLIKLILRFMDLHKGEILIDDQDISSTIQDSLRNNIAYVPQEPLLFHRTILENIRYAKPDASDEEVIQAAKKAYAHNFIVGLTNKYDTLVGERGVKLSGGERQRVAIARAILKNTPILILDEATSQLDSQSESYIQNALKTLMANKTVIVIAHRLSTIKQMDRIVVLEKGKIVEEGSHDMLLELSKGTYQKLWQIQVGGFKKSP